MSLVNEPKGHAPMEIGNITTQLGEEQPISIDKKIDELCAVMKGKGYRGKGGGPSGPFGYGGKGGGSAGFGEPAGYGGKDGGPYGYGGKGGGPANYKNYGGKADTKGKGRGKAGKGGKGGSGSKTLVCYNCGGVGHPRRLCPTPANSCEDMMGQDEPEQDHDQGDGEEWTADYPVEICMLEAEQVSKPKKTYLEAAMERLPRCPGRRRQYESTNMFGYLATEEEADDSARQELNAVDYAEGWVKITAVVDSGAGDNVLPQKELPFIPMSATERSKSGRGFCGPSGEPIQNFGQKKVIVKTAEGQARTTTWQVANVRRPLMSVSKMTKAGNDVRFNDSQPHIHNVKTGERTKLRKEGNIFVVDLWVKLPAPPGIGSHTMQKGRLSRCPGRSKGDGKGRASMEVDYVERRSGFARQVA